MQPGEVNEFVTRQFGPSLPGSLKRACMRIDERESAPLGSLAQKAHVERCIEGNQRAVAYKLQEQRENFRDWAALGVKHSLGDPGRSEERRVGKECRSRWS